MNRPTPLPQRHPVAFGRRMVPVAVPMPEATSLIGDLRLFASFFLGGFVFMAVYLA